MAYGITKQPPVDESELLSFIETLSTLRAEEWQKRIAALKQFVDSTPDYSTTPLEGRNGESDSNDSNGARQLTPWYRSSKSVRRLAMPLKSLLLDARSAVVKEATELIGTLMIVKLQPHPSLTMVEEGEDGNKTEDAAQTQSNGGLETINGALDAKKIMQQPPPPAFVGRLLFKDLLPAILDLSKQTVKLIRSYGVSMTLDILPHCRVKSCIVVLLERMKTYQNRTVREDCARYLRCVLETWPWDPTATGSCDNISNDDIGIVNSRKEERLSLDSTRQIGLGLGRTLSDSAKPVREEAKRGFQVLFKRFRPIWNEVMSSGVVRDVRLRKKMLEVAARSDGKEGLFDDMASLGEGSLNTAVSGLSYASVRSNRSHRSAYASRGMASTGVPTVIGTPKVTPRRARYSPGTSPSFMRGTGSSASRNAEQGKIQAKEASDTYAINQYVTSSGHVMTTPSPRKGKYLSRPLYGEREEDVTSVQQPFAALLQTPNRSMTHLQSPLSKQKSCKVLRRRLSCRISGIKRDIEIPDTVQSPSHLMSINETEDNNGTPPTASKDTHLTEITNVALEVIAAHLSHLDQIEASISKEKDLLLDLNKKLGIHISDATNAAELADRLASLSEEQVCDYFESVHVCVDKQRNASEDLLREMERISQGDVSTVSGLESPVSMRRHDDVAQSPLSDPDQTLQRNLRDEFGD